MVLNGLFIELGLNPEELVVKLLIFLFELLLLLLISLDLLSKRSNFSLKPLNPGRIIRFNLLNIFANAVLDALTLYCFLVFQIF